MTGEIISFCSELLTAFLQNSLLDAGGDIISSVKNKQIEQRTIEDIEGKVNDEFEQEKIKEWLSELKRRIKQTGYIFSEQDKKKFIDEFFSQYPELKYTHSQNSENVILKCIDEINNWANGILSDENKIVMASVQMEGQKNTEKITQQLYGIEQEIFARLNEIIAKNNVDAEAERQREEYELNRKKYFDRIENLYRIQNYVIKSKNEYFVAEQKSGIIRSSALVIPVYSETDELSMDFIKKIMEIIDSESKANTYQYIHIVTNGILDKSEIYFFPYKDKLTVLDEHQIINRIMDFTSYLNNNIIEYRNSNLYGHYIDVLDLNTSEPLENSVRDFLQETQYNAFLILGDYGCGKTSFLTNFVYQLSSEYLSNESEYIPIFVPLKEYSKAINMENLFLDIFVNKCHMSNVSIEAFKLMLRYMKFVLLFDGFDEVAKRVNYDVKFEIFSQICQYCSENTKVIVTCRPNYFQENKEYKKLIKNSYLQFEPSAVNNAMFIETFIADLDSRQIHEYIDSYQDVLSRAGLNAGEVEYLISHTHDLTDLSRRPFLLNIIVQTLPEIISNINDEEKENTGINAASLYRAYTDLWLDRQNSKGNTLIRKEDKLHFCTYIAYKMYSEDILSIHFSKMPDEIREYFSNLNRMDEIDYFSHDIQSCSFMNSDGKGNFKFIHKSFMEYFVARYIVERLQKCKDGEDAAANNILSIRDISTEVALFINDMLQDDSELYQRVQTLVEELLNSATNDRVRQNAVTILSKMDHNMALDIKDGDSYSGDDFSYSTIKERTIIDVDFSRASFYGAIIQNVTFINCDFIETNFQKARLINVDFTYQSLEYADLSYCEIKKCTFRECTLKDAKISQSVLENNNFRGCDMSGIEANGTKYKNNYNCQSALGVPYEMH